MIARTVSTGWQTILADLSLILFMVTAAALANAPDGPLGTDEVNPHAARAAPHKAPHPPVITAAPKAEPVGVWRSGPGAPDLQQWLNEVARDPRLRLTIIVHYAPGGRDRALLDAAKLDRAAGPRGNTARIVIEPGEPEGASAVVEFDADTGTQLARQGA